MNNHAAFGRTVRSAAVLVLVCAASGAGFGAETTVTRTNWVDRWITNVIEIQMPANRFVNEYRTNRVEQFRTNYVDVYSTNWVVLTLTNRLMVEAVRTNLKTLNLTNWETVLVMKTNWFTQPVTNVVELDFTRNGPGTSETAGPPKGRLDPKDPAVDPAEGALPASLTDALVMQASRTTWPPSNNRAEVQLTVRCVEAGAPLHVRQWRVEREDGSVLCYGQDQDFKRELTLGKYRVEVRAQRAADGPLLAARGTLAVTATTAVLEQKRAGKM